MVDKQYLNLGTLVCNENCDGGLMICGPNWGGKPKEGHRWDKNMYGDKLFSDASNNRQPSNANDYNNRLVKWFDLWGHTLATTEDKFGPFERSILLTTWLPSQSPSVEKDHNKKYYASHFDCFEFHVAKFRPQLIILASLELLVALNLPELKDRVLAILGPSENGKPTIHQHEIGSGSEKRTPFKIGIQRFREADVIALPHPTGAVGISDDYIASFKDLLSPIIEAYKAKRGFPPR